MSRHLVEHSMPSRVVSKHQEQAASTQDLSREGAGHTAVTQLFTAARTMSSNCESFKKANTQTRR